MDLSKMSMSQKLAGGGAALYVIAWFLPWFSFSYGGLANIDVTASGSDLNFFWGTLPFLCALAVLALVAIPVFAGQVDLSKVPAPAILGAAGLAAFLTILKLLIGETAFDRSWGLFIAAIASGVMAYGAFLIFKEGGGDIKNIGASMNKPDGGSTMPPPPPPPA